MNPALYAFFGAVNPFMFIPSVGFHNGRATCFPDADPLFQAYKAITGDETVRDYVVDGRLNEAASDLLKHALRQKWGSLGDKDYYNANPQASDTCAYFNVACLLGVPVREKKEPTPAEVERKKRELIAEHLGVTGEKILERDLEFALATAFAEEDDEVETCYHLLMPGLRRYTTVHEQIVILPEPVPESMEEDDDVDEEDDDVDEQWQQLPDAWNRPQPTSCQPLALYAIDIFGIVGNNPIVFADIDVEVRKYPRLTNPTEKGYVLLPAPVRNRYLQLLNPEIREKFQKLHSQVSSVGEG